MSHGGRGLVPAGLRTWRRIAARIGLTEAEALAALGGLAAADVARWAAVEGGDPAEVADVPLALVERLSHALAVWELSVALYGGPSRNLVVVEAWWRGPNHGDAYSGRPPRDLIASGNPLDLSRLRCVLESAAR